MHRWATRQVPSPIPANLLLRPTQTRLHKPNQLSKGQRGRAEADSPARIRSSHRFLYILLSRVNMSLHHNTCSPVDASHKLVASQVYAIPCRKQSTEEQPQLLSVLQRGGEVDLQTATAETTQLAGLNHSTTRLTLDPALSVCTSLLATHALTMGTTIMTMRTQMPMAMMTRIFMSFHLRCVSHCTALSPLGRTHHICFLTRLAPRRNPCAETARLSDM